MANPRTKIDDPDLADLLQGIADGRVALPNFQRDFDWSDSDVRSLLATVLNGWPMGSLLLIDGDEKTEDFYKPRAFEFAPSLRGVPETIVLDGQQRLTSLYSALYQRSDLVYAVKFGGDLDWGQIDTVDAAMRTFKRRQWERDYPTPADQWAHGLLPISALRSAADFYAWRDSANLGEQDLLEVTNLYRDELSGLHRYRVPALRIDGRMPPAAVARIFERVNKTGVRLGVFDLMVAKSFTLDFNLKTRWDLAKEQYPRLGVFYGDNGTAPLQVMSLRTLEDVRSSAVLKLTAATIHDNWEKSVRALDAALALAESRLGVVRADWVPYASLVVVLAALDWDEPIDERASALEAWFWRSALSGRYAAGSNTIAVSDFRRLREDVEVGRQPFAIDSPSLLESTKKSSGALHRAWLCALAAAYRQCCADYEDVELGARSVLPRGGRAFDEEQHLLSVGFALTVGGETLPSGPFLVPPEVPTGQVVQSDVEEFLRLRAEHLVSFLTVVCGVKVQLAEVDVQAEGIAD